MHSLHFLALQRTYSGKKVFSSSFIYISKDHKTSCSLKSESLPLGVHFSESIFLQLVARQICWLTRALIGHYETHNAA